MFIGLNGRGGLIFDVGMENETRNIRQNQQDKLNDEGQWLKFYLQHGNACCFYFVEITTLFCHF